MENAFFSSLEPRLNNQLCKDFETSTRLAYSSSMKNKAHFFHNTDIQK